MKSFGVLASSVMDSACVRMDGCTSLDVMSVAVMFFVVDVDGPYQIPNTLERIYFLLRFAVRTNSTASSEETVSPSCGL